MLTLADAERAAGLPAAEWAGKCHSVSLAVAPLVQGVVRRGNFLGVIAPRSYFGRRGAGAIQQHSWVELPDGRVLDPTRFAFTGRKRDVLWVGPADEYDIGGCRLYAGLVEPPPDAWQSTREPVVLALESVGFVLDLLGGHGQVFGYDDDRQGNDASIEISWEQAFWLSNLPIVDDDLARSIQGRPVPRNLPRAFAAEVFEALERAGCGALIPIDRRDWILGR